MHQFAISTRTLLFLVLLTLLTGSIALLAPLPRFAHAAPPSGWVKADSVSGGCDAYGNCSSEVTPGSATLYEYRPDRESVGRDTSVNDVSLANHGGYPTFERRDRCSVDGVYYYWSAGVWHHGGYWTLTYTATGGERWIGPSRQHWAFEHQDTCQPIPRTPTSTPIVAPPTATPPGFVPTATSTGFNPTPTMSSLPTPEPTATMIPICYSDQAIPTGMGLTALQGSTLVNYQSPIGYYIPESPTLPGLYDDGFGGDPPWPLSLAAAPITPGQPVEVRFFLNSVSMTNPPENPLEPFTNWGTAKMFMYIKDLGTDLASSADDRVLFNLGSDGVNPTENRIANGRRIVQVQRWDLVPEVELLGPQTFSSYDWDAGMWWEERHTTDPDRGDYAPPDDPGWPRPWPYIAWGRNYLRTPDVMGFRFTPQPGHTYEILSDVNKKSCEVWYKNFRMARLTTVQPIDVGITLEAPAVTTPGDSFTYYLTVRNTTPTPSQPATITFDLPTGVTLRGSSVATAAGSSTTRLIWNRPGLIGLAATDEIAVTVQVAADAPERLVGVATIAMDGDSDPANNRATTSTRVVTLPTPQADSKLRIHSDLDPQQGIYTSTGSQITWPANEVLDFMPAITLAPADQPTDGLYRVEQRIVGWTLEQIGATRIVRGPQCKPGIAPSGADMEGANIATLPGCLYDYVDRPTLATMRGMAHSYWAQTLPGIMRSDVYVWTPLPAGPTPLILNYAVLTTARERGVDLDGDGSTTSILARTTTSTRAIFQVTLLAPRSRR